MTPVSPQLIPLKEYFESKFDSLQREIDSRYADLRHSTETATRALDKRLEGMNEFRDTLKDQAGRFVTREELGLVVDRLRGDIRNLEIAKANLEGKASQTSVHRTLAVALLGLIVSIIALVVMIVKGTA